MLKFLAVIGPARPGRGTPKLGGVAAPSKKCREATEAWRRRGGSPAKPCKQELWNPPACSAFLEFDGLAGTPPNLGVSRTVLLAGPITERKSAGRKQRTYRPTSLRGEFQTPNCRFCAGSTEAA